jgi:hypothetical protein
MRLIEKLVVKLRDKHFLDDLMGQPSPAAMREQDVLIIAYRNRARQLHFYIRILLIYHMHLHIELITLTYLPGICANNFIDPSMNSMCRDNGFKEHQYALAANYCYAAGLHRCLPFIKSHRNGQALR